MQRREFIRNSALLSALAPGALLFPGGELVAQTARYSPVLSASRLGAGEYRIGSWQQDHWSGSAAIGHRGHDSCSHPQRGEWLFFSRRPGREIFIVDSRSGQLKQQISAQPGYHYYGHGCLSADQSLLFTTENAIEDDGRGVIGVYDCQQNYRFIRHLSCGGIGPHQLALMPDGKTLVVAIGGIKTLPEHGRKTLNFDSMAPALNYMDADSGELLESLPSPDPYLSLRHLDVSAQGRVVVGGQYQAELPAPLPLVYTHRRGEALSPLQLGEVPLVLNKSYIASISIDRDEHYAVTTCPRDNTVLLWDLQQDRLANSYRLRDCAGAVFDPHFGQFIISTGNGELMALSTQARRLTPLAYAQGVHWDNHLRLADV